MTDKKREELIEEKARELHHELFGEMDETDYLYGGNFQTMKDFINSLLDEAPMRKPRGFPKVVCLCGSTRFTEKMLIKQWELTKQGIIVLSWCALPDSYFTGEDTAHIGDQEGVKEIVDEVHCRKIDLADEVFILNVGGYIGKSTQAELDYAKKKGKSIRFLEPEWEVEG